MKPGFLRRVRTGVEGLVSVVEPSSPPLHSGTPVVRGGGAASPLAGRWHRQRPVSPHF